jgi:hypothetical protein
LRVFWLEAIRILKRKNAVRCMLKCNKAVYFDLVIFIYVAESGNVRAICNLELRPQILSPSAVVQPCIQRRH